jgi:transposase InsO family protein
VAHSDAGREHQPRHSISTYNHSKQAALRAPVESAQYTSFDYTQLLDDHDVLGSIGTVGDAYDNAAAESFVDTFRTELPERSRNSTL